ncbi:diacylglycerol kinase family protein [[Mycoplasma] testudinis]|uniref:diacylglycerol kinase family protein n=1 Tax=[Mycoplasma] testudinis TaxID=33924 RepID=UPI00056B61B9|nr:diacylglycerol kinase family protein [[Mycoplasma] testudinis]
METRKNRESIWKKIRYKFSHAFSGFFFALKEEVSLVIHVIIALIVLIISAILHNQMSYIDWAIIVLVIGFVISMELLNTAIENLVDTVSFKFNINAKKIKDISAAATLILAIVAIIVGLLILVPKIVIFFS